MVLVPKDAFQEPEWAPLLDDVWKTIGVAFGASRVARKAEIDAAGTRDSRLQLLRDARGEGGVVQVKENGLVYEFDATLCMFSSGNVTEKARMGRVNAGGQVVVDLYCGIGYFTIPLLVHAGAQHVHACDWNPHAAAAMRRNAELNHVSDRITVYEGDNRCGDAPTQRWRYVRSDLTVCCVNHRLVADKLRDVADRVMLGLIPTSQAGWPVAVAVMKPQGGWMHVHENVHEAKLAEWTAFVASTITKLAADAGKRWTVATTHLEKVKSYAPRVFHVVVDLQLVAVE